MTESEQMFGDDGWMDPGRVVFTPDGPCDLAVCACGRHYTNLSDKTRRPIHVEKVFDIRSPDKATRVMWLDEKIDNPVVTVRCEVPDA